MKAIAVTLAGVLGLALQPQAPAPAVKGSGVVLGRVLDVLTGTPIGGAIVTIGTASPDPSRRDAASPTVLTSADGYFAVRDLAGGQYAVSATAFGYAGTAAPPPVAHVLDSEHPAVITLRLWKHGSISGTVVDEQGEPVAGVPVTALRRNVAAGRVMLQSEGWGETDDRGIYRIAQLPVGNYAIGVLQTAASLPSGMVANTGSPGTRNPEYLAMLRSGYRPSDADGFHRGDRVLQQLGPAPPLTPDGRLLVYTNTLAPASASAADATVVTLGSAEARTGIDVAIRFVPTVRIAGVATGPSGPVAGVGIRLLPVNGDAIDALTQDFHPAGAALAVTDAAGGFVFPAVPAGSYTLQASMVDLNPVDESATRALFASQPLNVGDTDLDGLVVALHRGLRIAGRVEFRGGPPPVLAPARPVVVGLRPLGAGVWRTVAARLTTGEAFASEGDPPGVYIVYTSGPEGWTVDTISRGAQVLEDDVLTLEAEDVRDLVVTFTRTPTKLSGSIATAAGAPESDAVVIVFPADTTLWRDGVINSRRVRRVPATSAGTYEFTGLPPGDYYIAAVHPRYTSAWNDPASLEGLTSAAARVQLRSGDSATVVLKTIVPGGR